MRGDEGLVGHSQHALSLLRWQWLAVAVFYGIAIIVAHGALPVAWRRADDRLWLAMASGVASVQLIILWLALHTNHAPNKPKAAPYPWLGIANCMTLMRGMLVALLAGFVFAPMPWGWMAWIPFLLYGIERVIDLLDGYAARMTHRESRLGGILDMEFDGLGLLIATAVAIQYDKIPAWYLLLGLGRPLFVLGIWLRQKWGMKVHPLAPSDLRRIVAGVQTVFVAFTLAPLLAPELTWFAAYVFAVPLVASFGRDWLVVSDVLDANNPTYLRLRANAKWLCEGWLPPLARWVAAAGIVAIVATSTWGVGSGAETRWVLVAFALLSALGLTFGILSRFSSFVFLLVVCANVALTGMHQTDALMVVCGAIVLHVGGGRFTIWSPEERFVREPLGTNHAAAQA